MWATGISCSTSVLLYQHRREKHETSAMTVILRLFVLGVCVVAVSCIIRCTEDFCTTVDCAVAAGDSAPPCGPDQRLNEQGTFCGCCRTCVTQLAEGSNCGITLMIGGPPPVVECAAGLVCSRDTATCVAQEVPDDVVADE
ncbi:uncharacterized protein LOC110830119 [Zootermopsis nevadensis]|uniref:IGFBP N-terminal domain-containing protein n=1 Tax=Zootermopsis nevadensis TaxID=136037 RepID=A0A067R6Y6_ZOONE|nr:uncharacterized protein LOC110830119 [Zootermopsis nevadensis]KDR19195.1 hypothetical protein L798_06250 [Zootermopsis nevadensis]